MKRLSALLALALVLLSALAAQDADSVVLAYRRNFARSSLASKLELIKEASTHDGVPMGSLYDMALAFAVDNSALLGADSELKELAVVSAREAGREGYAKASDNLWQLFQDFSDVDIRAAALSALGYVGSGNMIVITELNELLADQNTDFRGSKSPDYPVLEACIEALGHLGDGSSFPVLFSAYQAGYSPEVSAKAAKALASIKGDYRGYLLKVIASNPPLDKAAAYAAGMDNPVFAAEDRGGLAEGALAACLASLDGGTGFSAAERSALHDMRTSAVRVIHDLKWQKASPLAVRNFRLLGDDYSKGAAPKSEFIDAIACLGEMGTAEAAQALALFLQYLNSQTELGASYDEAILITTITALGELGDKSSFDYLLQIGYLQYSDAVKAAARDALLKLRW